MLAVIIILIESNLISGVVTACFGLTSTSEDILGVSGTFVFLFFPRGAASWKSLPPWCTDECLLDQHREDILWLDCELQHGQLTQGTKAMVLIQG